MILRPTVIFFLLGILTIFVSAHDPQGKKLQKSQKKNGIPNATLMNINNFSSWYESNGKGEQNPYTGNSGLSFPRGTDYSIFTSGLMFGAICDDGIATGPRVSGASYNTGFTPGAILGNRTGITEDPNDAEVRIWRIRKNYTTAELKQDAAEFLSKQINEVTESDIEQIREQYIKDWEKWPTSKGAPFYDSNNDGIYTPQFETVKGKLVPILFPQADEPGLANADQVIWYVANDVRSGDSPWKTKPVGLELQTTIWGYKSAGALSNSIFKKYKVIYKGVAATSENSKLNQMYLTHWSDPDIGDPVDDFAGCDTNLNMGYIYNSKAIDASYRKFNIAPPAVGYDFLQGPIIPGTSNDTAIFDLKKRVGYKNLPMTSFIYSASGGNYTIPQYSLIGSLHWYCMMQGYPRYISDYQPIIDCPNKIINPLTGEPTSFWLSGDPVTGTGWIDETDDGWDGPGDRRFLQSSGPFTMALGDTQEIVIGVVGGVGFDQKESIVKMKENDRFVQFMYDKLFKIIPPAVSAEITYQNSQSVINIKAIASIGQFNSIHAKIYDTILQLFDDGLHNDGAANDGVYANNKIVELEWSQKPTSIDITFVDSENNTFTIPKMIERITTSGPIPVTGAQVIYDNINNDGVVNNGEYVNFTFTIKNFTGFNITGLKALVTTETEFGNEYAFGSVAATAEMSVPSTSPFAFRLPITYSDPNYKVNVKLTDDKGNVWNSEILFSVVQQNFIADSLSNIATNVVGSNDGQVGFVLYDKSIAGSKYDIWYGGVNTTRNWTVVKPIDGTDYATVTATMNALKQVPPINNLPNAKGTGTFTINDAKTQVSYSISVEGLSGEITASHIHIGSAETNGGVAYPITFSGNTAIGTWNIPDTLVDEFTSGNLYVNIHTAANPGGEIRGQIGDGLVVRQSLPPAITPTPSIFAYIENRFIGFSLFVGPAPKGRKSAKQTKPSVGNVLNQTNPEGTYRIVDISQNTFAGSKNFEDNITIEFNAGINWAIAVPYISPPPTPTVSYFIKIPFAVYKDTTRVWPVIFDVSNDSLWNVTGNPLWNGKKVFDRILGITDTRDQADYDISYYVPSNVVFPPTSNTIKGRLINGVNHVLSNLFFISETELGIPPQSGTTILFESNKSVKIGDIKTLTLTPTGVSIEQLTSIPETFSLSQNYPNPFNPTTRIEFALPNTNFATLKIYDIIGREVATILNEDKSAGRFMVEWNGKNNLNQQVASGVYFYQMKAGNFVQSKKMMLLK